jgi:uncharacterized membrane protein YfhO
MRGAKKLLINRKSNLKQQQTDLDLSVTQHHKYNQNNKDKKEENEKKTPMFVYLVQSKMTYFEGESSSLIQYGENDTNRLQEISLKAHT